MILFKDFLKKWGSLIPGFLHVHTGDTLPGLSFDIPSLLVVVVAAVASVSTCLFLLSRLFAIEESF